jgi:hypothetical protein
VKSCSQTAFRYKKRRPDPGNKIKFSATLCELIPFALISLKIQVMEETKKYTALYWILFILSVIAFFWLYTVIGGVCIFSLPFICTFFAKALDII